MTRENVKGLRARTKIWTNDFDTCVADSAADARRIALEAAGESADDARLSPIEHWREDARDEIAVVDQATGATTTRSAAEWVLVNGPGLLSSRRGRGRMTAVRTLRIRADDFQCARVHGEDRDIDFHRRIWARRLLRRGVDPWPACDFIAKQAEDWIGMRRSGCVTKSMIRVQIRVWEITSR